MLKNGQVFKNYKELCAFMGWEVKSGNTKIAQFKELDAKCKWHKEGNKIIIDEVYENAKELFKGETKVRKGKYNVEIGSSILAVVTSTLRSEQGVVYMRTQDLIIGTALANDKLFSGYIEEGFSKLEVSSYKDIAKKMTYKALENGLNWLNSSRTLKNEKVRMICVTEEEDFVKDKTYITREATVEEDNALFEGEQKILMELGYESIFNVIFKGELIEFGNRVTDYVLENYGIDIEYYYSAVKFTVTKFSKERGLQLASKKSDLNKEVWERTHKALVESAIKRRDRNFEDSKKALEQYKSKMTEGFGDNKFVNVIYAYPDYLDNFILLDKKYRG